MNFLRTAYKKFADWQRYGALPIERKRITFYAEDEASWVHYESIVESLIEKWNIPVAYVTSSLSDPIIDRQHSNLTTFYVGDGTIRTLFFSTLETPLMVMTMPDLNSFHIKRSHSYPVHYTYLFHSMVSTHMIYRKGAFDHFDSILCCGPHHMREIRETERIYGLKTKQLLPHGYGRLDALLNSIHPKKRNNTQSVTILIAPSWGDDGLLENHSHSLISPLLMAGFDIIVRPHPMTLKKHGRKFLKDIEPFAKDPKFRLETDMRQCRSMEASDLMISDWSGVALEYSFSSGKPVVFIDVPRKINNQEYEKCALEPIEVGLRNRLGTITRIEDLDQLPQLIPTLIKDSQPFDMQSLRQSTVFNIGSSGPVGAKHLVDILSSA